MKTAQRIWAAMRTILFGKSLRHMENKDDMTMVISIRNHKHQIKETLAVVTIKAVSGYLSCVNVRALSPGG